MSTAQAGQVRGLNHWSSPTKDNGLLAEGKQVEYQRILESGLVGGTDLDGRVDPVAGVGFVVGQDRAVRGSCVARSGHAAVLKNMTAEQKQVADSGIVAAGLVAAELVCATAGPVVG